MTRRNTETFRIIENWKNHITGVIIWLITRQMMSWWFFSFVLLFFWSVRWACVYVRGVGAVRFRHAIYTDWSVHKHFYLSLLPLNLVEYERYDANNLVSLVLIVMRNSAKHTRLKGSDIFLNIKNGLCGRPTLCLTHTHGRKHVDVTSPLHK